LRSSSPESTYIAVAIFAVAIGFMVFNNRRDRKRLRDLAEALDERSGEVRGFMTVRLEGHYQGRAVTLRHKPASRYTPEEFRVRLAAPSSLEFRIGRQGMGTRLANKLGLKKDLEIGDPEVDERFALSSREPERFVSWLKSADEIARIESVFEFADALIHDDQALVVTIQGSGSTPRSVERMREILEALRPVAEAVERA
jgi:hypothetical protein